MRIFFGILVAIAITGCVSMPKSPVYGPYYQLYVEEMPAIEITYSSDRQCEQEMNSEIQQMDANARQQLMSGRMRMLCSNNSLKDRLPNKAVVVEIVTGKKYEARFLSPAACMVVLAEMKSKAHMIHCGW